MHLKEFTDRFTGLTRGLIARRKHPDEIAVTVKLTDQNETVFWRDVVAVGYGQHDGEIDICFSVRL